LLHQKINQMEILFSQRHNFAAINPMKDYCNIAGWNEYTLKYDNKDPFSNVTWLINQNVISLPAKLQKGKRRVYYYYSGESSDERVNLFSPTLNFPIFRSLFRHGSIRTWGCKPPRW
jgi:hypothetical protein